MARTSIDIEAPATAVYATLMDPWTYSNWVRGTKRIRKVDAEWPALGSRFHHSVGAGPLETRDQTRLLKAEPNRLVELEVQVWPVGTGRVRVQLEDRGGATHVEMEEHFIRGPAAWLNNPGEDLLVKLRNDWSMKQLKRIVEQRYRTRGGTLL